MRILLAAGLIGIIPAQSQDACIFSMDTAGCASGWERPAHDARYVPLRVTMKQVSSTWSVVVWTDTAGRPIGMTMAGQSISVDCSDPYVDVKDSI